MTGPHLGNVPAMEDTPICAAVERDLGLSFEELTGPRPEWTPSGPSS
jgi:hypothetical protein